MPTLSPLVTTPIWEVSTTATTSDGRTSNITRRFTVEPTADDLTQAQADFQAIADHDLPDPAPPVADPAIVAAVLAALKPGA